MLSVVVATYNRLESLRRTLESISAGTAVPHVIHVADGGSTDGTVEFLKSRPELLCDFQGRLIGTARAYNAVWRRVDTPYTVWLSDDTTVTPGTLDRAVSVLISDRRVGMVGLKMRDTAGPWTGEPYLGGISELGILNCNHGVLPTALLRTVGYFNESYRSYMVDPDLTASVLSAGRRVVMTKAVGVLHHRDWAEAAARQAAGGVEGKMSSERGGIDNAALYRRKFGFLAAGDTPSVRFRRRWFGRLRDRIFPPGSGRTMFGINRRDWINLGEARFIDPCDPWLTRDREYHLVQAVPRAVLRSASNPYLEPAMRAPQ